MQYSHHHNDDYHEHHRKMKASDTVLLTAIGIIVGVSVLILASEAFAADVRVTRPATTAASPPRREVTPASERNLLMRVGIMS